MMTKNLEGQRIGPYQFGSRIGAGGMGEVYQARDVRLDRIVAIKVLNKSVADDPRSRERFQREARAVAALNHPHICTLHDVGSQDGLDFLVMEYLEGETLAARLCRGVLPIVDAVRTGIEVLAALDAMHQRGITHRDLKPANIFLTPHGVKIVDFGVALHAPGPASVTRLTLTNPGTVVGTPKYMAPEQLMGTAVDARADLFAAGAILYEMLSGAAAFEGDTLPAVIENVLRGDVPVLAGSPAVVAVDRVIQRALAKPPAHRYPTAAAMADDLRTVLAGHGSTDPARARPVTRLMVLPFRLLRPDADIDFLAFSLADAVTHSLSPLQSVVVRSALAVTRFATEPPDLKTIASEGNVDAVLSGTLLHAGHALRVSAQLLEVPNGTILWSHSAQVSLDDIFELQDTLARHIVESLSLPLSSREHRALGHDVPSSARAYEFYLRANKLSHDSGSWEVARDLYLQCLQEDPRYAPAWARLGRVYHVIGKHLASADAYSRSEAALNRALELNPDLSIADRFYAQLELDLGRAQEAMVRLVRRASSAISDPQLFAALVSACRYCGLLRPSVAAYERATRLDPNVRTSVQHTFFMIGDYLRSAAESEQQWEVGNMGALALACAGHPDAATLGDTYAQRYANTRYQDRSLHIPEPDGKVLRAAVDELIASGFRDPEGLFYNLLKLAHAGQADRAVEIFADVVERGFYPFETFMSHPWLAPLRDRTDFNAVLQQAERRHDEARAEFIRAGGEALLGSLASVGH
jgi:non-specific serine/threonine protein kinase